MVLRDPHPILLIAGAVHDIFGIRLLAERRVAARRFRILRLEETDVLPRPAVVGGIGHPDGEVLARTDDAKAHPGLPPLVISHDEFGVYSGLALRNLLRGKVVGLPEDRKSTRLNSSHSQISYAVFCLKKKTKQHTT